MEIFFSSSLSQTELSGLLSERLSTSLPERKTEFLTAVSPSHFKERVRPKNKCYAAIYSAFFIACKTKQVKATLFHAMKTTMVFTCSLYGKKRKLGHCTKHLILHSTEKKISMQVWNDTRMNK